jgi:uncharacterized LabA/DUF88 family protein
VLHRIAAPPSASCSRLSRGRDRRLHRDLMHAGVEPRYLPMSQTRGEKGIDVALAVDALQVALDGKIDIAVLVSGDGDFVPLVRALNKQGVRVMVRTSSSRGRMARRVL